MTGFALDTNILSESRKARPHGAELEGTPQVSQLMFKRSSDSAVDAMIAVPIENPFDYLSNLK